MIKIIIRVAFILFLVLFLIYNASIVADCDDTIVRGLISLECVKVMR